MKDKKMTYLLIGAVVLVWGLIVYRIINAMEPDEPIPKDLAISKEALFKREDHQKDTFRVHSDYPDPFFKSNEEVMADKNVQKIDPATEKRLATPPRTPIDWSGIRYLGYIKGQKGSVSVGLISLQNQEFSLEEKASRQGLALIKLTPDSALLSYKGEKKYVKIL